MNVSSKTFCSMAWNHQFVDPTGRVKPCCRFEEQHRPPENNLHTNTLENIFLGSWMNSVRDKMLHGQQVDGCTRCYQEESAGKRSLRERYNESSLLPITDLVDIDRPRIRWIELAISNDCNLACRMCDSRYSWRWFKEEQSHWGRTLNQKEHSESDVSNIYPFLQDIVHLKFTGGEPLLTKSHWQLIDKLLNERDCSEIFLNYSTNCTLYPKDRWIDKWNRFKQVEFALSFDSCDPLESEYIRWPAKYNVTEPVTREFLKLNTKPNYTVLLRSTISLLNVWNMPETLLWWIDHDPRERTTMNPTHLTHPNYLSVTVLPSHLKKLVEDKFSEHSSNRKIWPYLDYIINHMNSHDNTSLLPKLRDYISKTDTYRDQSFIEAYPQFSSIIDQSL